VVESSTDPRSPLKVAALCRTYAIPARFPELEATLKKIPTKRKVFMNQREMEAAEREKAKRERLRQDKEERLAELYRREAAESQ